ncbi:hypothetical protein F7U66_01600 [Vibrio parahaemolyticus]|nr:hypothetical protein [Vibrio parahaemolyticus]
MKDLELFFTWCHSHLKQASTIETDEGEETYFQKTLIGGYNEEEESYYLEDNKMAKKLHDMWSLFLSN